MTLNRAGRRQNNSPPVRLEKIPTPNVTVVGTTLHDSIIKYQLL